MKKITLIVMTLFLFIAALSIYAAAQVEDRLQVNIPFDFTVRNKVMPADTYTVWTPDSVSDGMMALRDDQGHEIYFLTENAEDRTTPAKSELIFKRLGDRYFLSEIFERGNNIGAEVVKSRTEQKLEKENARSQQASVTIMEQDTMKAGN